MNKIIKFSHRYWVNLEIDGIIKIPLYLLSLPFALIVWGLRSLNTKLDKKSKELDKQIEYQKIKEIMLLDIKSGGGKFKYNKFDGGHVITCVGKISDIEKKALKDIQSDLND